MKYSVDKKERYTIFSVEEENLNSLVAPELKSELFILINEGIKNLIIDLGSVSFVDSSGLSALLTGNRLWNQVEGSFLLTGINAPSVKKLIEISKLDNVLTIIPTLEESIDYIMMEEVSRELEGESPSEEEE